MKMKSILFGASAFLMCSSAIGQTHVTTGTQKYTLLEEGTGTWCGYCPDGSQRLQEVVEPTYPRCITVAFHNGDPMELTGDPFNSAYITGFPGAAIDRVPFTHPNSSGTPVTSINVGRGYWSTDVGVRDALSPNFSVELTGLYDSTTKTITLTVKGKALAAMTGDYRINAYVVEDSISSAPTNYEQHSYLNGTSSSWYFGKGSVIPAADYSHMNVVMKVLASGGSIYGDAAFTNPAVGATASKTYTYVIPSTSTPKYTKVVGLVQKYGSATTDRPIENAARAKVRLMWKNTVSVPTTNIMEDVELFPNPAANYVHVNGQLNNPSETKITIVNTIGQVVSENIFPANGTMFSENISLNNISNGVYYITIENNGEKVSRKLTVAK
jgi:hypothetical protein